MSDSKNQNILSKKRGHSKKSKSIGKSSKSKHIQKKLKFGKKSKNVNHLINIIKPRLTKGAISNQNFPPNNILSTLEKTFPEEENAFKKEDSCQENSLGQLTKNFINYIKTTGKKSININDVVNELGVKKRRIYDITNVLQGIGYLQKSGKNEIVWTKGISNKGKLKKKLSHSKKYPNNFNTIKNSKQNINQLEKEKQELENEINNFKEEFNSIAKKNEFAKFGYITIDDLKSKSLDDKVDLLLIKATKGTVMNILDKNESKVTYDKIKKLKESKKMEINDSMLNLLKKSNQIMFECPEDLGLKIYCIKKGVVQKNGTNLNNKNNNDDGKNPVMSKVYNNNYNINNLIQNKINFSINYNVNLGKEDNLLQNNSKNNLINNNYKTLNNKKENVDNINYQANNNNFPQNYSVNYTERVNNETVPPNIIVNNEEKNIAVYATPLKCSYTQKHIYYSQNGGGLNYCNYKNNQNKKGNNNPSNNFVEENFSFTTNSPFTKNN